MRRIPDAVKILVKELRAQGANAKKIVDEVKKTLDYELKITAIYSLAKADRCSKGSKKVRSISSRKYVRRHKDKLASEESADAMVEEIISLIRSLKEHYVGTLKTIRGELIRARAQVSLEGESEDLDDSIIGGCGGD